MLEGFGLRGARKPAHEGPHRGAQERVIWVIVHAREGDARKRLVHLKAGSRPEDIAEAKARREAVRHLH